VLGSGDDDAAPSLTLETTSYELLRILFGRGSVDQVRAARWSGGDQEAAVQALHIFDHQPDDRTD